MNKEQKGVALLIVLLLISTVSLISIRITEKIDFALRRTTTLENRIQAMWYIHHAEEFAIEYIAQKFSVAPAGAGWLGESIEFTIDTNARARIRLDDGSGCFNLNSVVKTIEGETGFEANDANITRYEFLLLALGIEKRNAVLLADALVDWIDGDLIERPHGAEDFSYERDGHLYRTGNTLLADISELYTIKHYNKKIIKILEKFVCTYPNTSNHPVNINTIPTQNSPVLFALGRGVVPLKNFQSLISNRPEQGYSSTEAALKISAFGSFDEAEIENFIDIKSRYILFSSEIDYGKAFVEVATLFKISEAGRVIPVVRRIGESL